MCRSFTCRLNYIYPIVRTDRSSSPEKIYKAAFVMATHKMWSGRLKVPSLDRRRTMCSGTAYCVRVGWPGGRWNLFTTKRWPGELVTMFEGGGSHLQVVCTLVGQKQRRRLNQQSALLSHRSGGYTMDDCSSIRLKLTFH